MLEYLVPKNEMKYPYEKKNTTGIFLNCSYSFERPRILTWS